MTQKQTSMDAYVSLTAGRLTVLKAGILAILAHHGPLTDEELIAVYEVADEAGEETKTDSDASIRSRRAELVAAGQVVDTGERRPSRSGRSMTVWGLAVISPKRAEPFDPAVDLPSDGMRPNSMPGRPDRYVNLKRARSQAADNQRVVESQAERDRLRGLPWREGPLRLVFGQMTCPECGATGGNKLEGPCWRCQGTGVL